MRARMLYKLLVLQFPLRAVKSGCRILFISPFHQEPQEKKQELRPFKKTFGSDLTNPQIFKKIDPSELPIIGINSGGNISHIIKNALITYCQKELGPIYKIFTELAYRPDITVDYDEADLTDKEDPLDS